MDSNDLTVFPHIDVLDIRKRITFGWYQINQGLGYIAEHLNSNGNYEIRINKDLNSGVNGLNVVYCCFQSRHSNSKKYDVFIHYTPGVNDYSTI